MEENEDAQDQARLDYVKRRQHEMYNEVENLWLDYLQKLDYPRVNFPDYVSRHHPSLRDGGSPEYLIWVWKFVRSFSEIHQN